MCSYYDKKDILDMFPLNYDELDNEKQVRIIQDIALSCNMSIDKVIELMNE